MSKQTTRQSQAASQDLINLIINSKQFINFPEKTSVSAIGSALTQITKNSNQSIAKHFIFNQLALDVQRIKLMNQWSAKYGVNEITLNNCQFNSELSLNFPQINIANENPNISHISKDLAALISNIIKNGNVKLTVKNYHYPDDFFENHFLYALKSSSKIKSLNLNLENFTISKQSMELFANNFKQFKCLESLSLKDSSFENDVNCFKSILKVIITNNVTLICNLSDSTLIKQLGQNIKIHNIESGSSEEQTLHKKVDQAYKLRDLTNNINMIKAGVIIINDYNTLDNFAICYKKFGSSLDPKKNVKIIYKDAIVKNQDCKILAELSENNIPNEIVFDNSYTLSLSENLGKQKSIIFKNIKVQDEILYESLDGRCQIIENCYRPPYKIINNSKAIQNISINNSKIKYDSFLQIIQKLSDNELKQFSIDKLNIESSNHTNSLFDNYQILKLIHGLLSHRIEKINLNFHDCGFDKSHRDEDKAIFEQIIHHDKVNYLGGDLTTHHD